MEKLQQRDSVLKRIHIGIHEPLNFSKIQLKPNKGIAVKSF